MTENRIRIEKLAFGGNGIGRIDGKVCFVPLACPGDELLVSIASEKRSYLTGRIIEVVSPSPLRVAPPCPLFGSCGGCSWQHVAYPQQLEAKRQILAETLWRGARVENERVAATLPSPDQFGYRSRVQFKLFHRDNRVLIGFFRQGSHFVEDAPSGCPIALPAINRVMQGLREVLAGFREPAAIPQINVECGEQGIIAVVNYIGKEPDRAAAFFEQRLAALAPLTGIFLQTGRKVTLRRVAGADLLAYAMPKTDGSVCTLTFPPGGFSQVNQAQNRAMLGLVREMAQFRGDERLLDVYCGNGNFSLPLADEVAAITGIEEYEGSIAAAVANSRRNGIGNGEFTAVDAAQGVRRLADAGQRYDVVILDPPRSGAADTAKELLRLRPAKIIYISCDPSTLARDCGILAGGGYRVRTSVPVDMFPQTYHLESITLLTQAS